MVARGTSLKSPNLGSNLRYCAFHGSTKHVLDAMGPYFLWTFVYFRIGGAGRINAAFGLINIHNNPNLNFDFPKVCYRRIEIRIVIWTAYSSEKVLDVWESQTCESYWGETEVANCCGRCTTVWTDPFTFGTSAEHIHSGEEPIKRYISCNIH